LCFARAYLSYGMWKCVCVCACVCALAVTTRCFCSLRCSHRCMVWAHLDNAGWLVALAAALQRKRALSSGDSIAYSLLHGVSTLGDCVSHAFTAVRFEHARFDNAQWLVALAVTAVQWQPYSDSRTVTAHMSSGDSYSQREDACEGVRVRMCVRGCL
jgi:hypothetical protein